LQKRRTAAIVLANVASILLEKGQRARATSALFRSLSLGDPNGHAAAQLANLGEKVTDSEMDAAIEKNAEIFLKAMIEIAALQNNAVK